MINLFSLKHYKPRVGIISWKTKLTASGKEYFLPKRAGGGGGGGGRPKTHKDLTIVTSLFKRMCMLNHYLRFFLSLPTTLNV